MARSRTNYNVDTTTKILDIHKQFMGGLKTVDTDDSVRDFFLRDAENLSLSEFGFVERRYGLVKDANFEKLVDLVDAPTFPDETVLFKDRLQGYFEYTRKDRVKEVIVFYNGYLYLNGVLITTLYTYPTDFDPILGRFNNNIDSLSFANYIDRVHPNLAFNSVNGFNSIGRLFNTGRQIDGVRIDDRMFFFTGVYPIVYEGTGEFYLLPEFVTNFEQLALFSHNLHTNDLDAVYTAGFAPQTITGDIVGSTKPLFGEVGYAPMYPYMEGEGSGLRFSINYKTPNISPFTLPAFTRFLDGTTKQTGNGSQYLELVPEVYTRPAGLSSTEVDVTWTRVPQKNVLYDVLNNQSTGLTADKLTYLNENPDRAELDTLSYPNVIDPFRSITGTSINSTSDKLFPITITELPSGLFDILIEYKIYQIGYQEIGTGISFKIEEIASTQSITRAITITKQKTNDYLRFVKNDQDEIIPTPVNDPAALWTCNRVLNHYGKLMAYGSLIHPERVFISHPTFIHYFPFFFTRDFETDEFDPIQQITPFMNILVVQTESYSWGLKGIDAVLGAPNFYTPFVISPLYGTIAPNSVRPVRNQLFFLSRDGIVSLQSLYAIDEQYNVKHIDTNIENIVPLDPDAVAIQYDNQYWIHFPNTANHITLRYHVDMKAWMKDTYFEYNGLQTIITNEGEPNEKISYVPQLSPTVFNGVHKYLREDEKLVLITNPMKQVFSSDDQEDDKNYRINRLYVDYSIATDLKELPRTLFETSFLDQGRPFNEKKYIEEKMDFTIQNEYHLGKEPIFRDEDLVINDTVGGVVPSVKIYTMDNLPLQKNHDYEVVIPQRGLAPVVVDGNLVYPNQTADIRSITVRLFDILGREVDTLVFKPDQPEMPSIKNFLTFPGSNSVGFQIFNNDIVPVNVSYIVRSTSPGNVGIVRSGTVFGVQPQTTQTVNEVGIPFGPGQIELTAQRPNITPPVLSDSRILNFQMEDGIYDDFVFEPIIPSKTPLQLSAIPSDTRGGEEANRIVITWVDQNPGSTNYRVQYRNVTTNSGVLSLKILTATTDTISFTDQQATALQGNVFEISVEALYNGVYSPAATLQVALEVFDQIPNSVNSSTMNTIELRQNQTALNFQWQDVLYENQYQLYWRYVNEIFPTLGDYPAERVVLLPANQTNYLFDASGALVSNDPLIFKDAVVEVKVRGINANGVSANLGVREGVFRGIYDPDDFVLAPISPAGFRVTIPAALKTTPYGSTPHLFEHFWEVNYKKAGTVTYTTVQRPVLPQGEVEANRPANSNIIEVIDLDPQTIYDVWIRGGYLTNGTVETLFAPVLVDQVFQVTTGQENIDPLSLPEIVNGSIAVTQNNFLSFTLRNNDVKQVKIHYLVNNSATMTTLADTEPATAILSQGQFQNISNIPLAAGQTWYIHVKSYPAPGVSAAPSAIRTSSSFTSFAPPPATAIVASFNSNGGTPNYGDQSTTGSSLSVFNPGSPTRTGFIFGGWDPSVPRTISQSTQFVAQWTEEQGSNLPLAPSSVSISSPANNQVSISWTAVSGATSYQWELYFDGVFLEGGSTTSALSVSRSGIPAGPVQARVRACNANGCGAQRSSATITVSGVGLA
jgi:hypothetical protein